MNIKEQALGYATTVVTHFLWAAHNIQPGVLITWAYPDWDNLHPDYQEQKLGLLKRDGLAVSWFRLDDANRKHLMQRIEDHYSMTDTTSGAVGGGQ